MTPDEREALAAACERALDDMLRYSPRWPEGTIADAAILRAHARALRDGRVTVSEEAT